MKKYVGEVWVDSGQVMIVDPCYLKSWEDTDAFPDEKPEGTFNYSGACEVTLSEERMGQIDHGAVVSSTAYGDGVYPVYANIEDDVIKSLTIEFVSGK